MLKRKTENKRRVFKLTFWTSCLSDDKRTNTNQARMNGNSIFIREADAEPTVMRCRTSSSPVMEFLTRATSSSCESVSNTSPRHRDSHVLRPCQPVFKLVGYWEAYTRTDVKWRRPSCCAPASQLSRVSESKHFEETNCASGNKSCVSQFLWRVIFESDYGERVHCEQKTSRYLSKACLQVA